jgi:hypothetical protein
LIALGEEGIFEALTAVVQDIALQGSHGLNLFFAVFDCLCNSRACEGILGLDGGMCVERGNLLRLARQISALGAELARLPFVPAEVLPYSPSGKIFEPVRLRIRPYYIWIA